MRNATIFLLLISIVLLAVPATTNGQTIISLSTPSVGTTNGVVFSGLGSSTTYDSTHLGLSVDGGCTGSNCKSQTVVGTLYNGYYSISGTPTINLAAGVPEPPFWTVSQSAPLTFCFSQDAGCTGTVYLEGNLQLLNMLNAGTTGAFNYNSTGNLTDLTGLVGLTSEFPGGTGVVNLNFSTHNMPTLGSLLGTTSSKFGTINFLTVSTTPEPTSMLLFGSGLLALGAILRRRKGTAVTV
jgi:PEP-CTERM motif